jgi:hypothetical protein
MSPHKRDSTQHAKARRCRYRKAQERLARDRRQAQRAAEALHHFRQHRTHLGEYLVYCSPDSRTWYAYVMWPAQRKVIGPYPAACALLPYTPVPCKQDACRDTSWHKP